MANQIDIQVIADIKQILTSINTLNQRFEDFSQQASDSSDKVNKKLGGITGTVAKIGLAYQGLKMIWQDVSGVYGGLIREADNAEASQIKLRQALKSTGQYSKETVDDLNAYASELQALTGIDNDVTVGTMGMLIAMNLSGKEVKRATSLAQDLSVVMETDMRSAARVMADAFNGQTGILSRYIKGLDEADIEQRGAISIIEQLERAVGGQARALGQEAPGATLKYNAALGDLKETLGTTLRDDLLPFIVGGQRLFELMQKLPAVIQTVIMMVSALGIAYKVLNIAMSKTNLIIGAILVAGSALYSLFKREKNSVESVASSMAWLNREREKFLSMSKNVAEISDVDQLKRLREDAEAQLKLAQENLEGWKNKNKQIMSALAPAFESFFEQWKKENADYIKSNPAWQAKGLKDWQDYLKQQIVGYEKYVKALNDQGKRLKPQEKLKTEIEDLQNSVDYLHLVEGKSLEDSRAQYLKYLQGRITAIKGNTDEEISEKERLKMELARIQDEIDRDQKEKVDRTNEEIADIITGGGFSSAYESVMERIRQKLIVRIAEEIKLAAWLEKTKFALKEAWAGKTLAMEQLFSGKEILLNLKTSASNFIAGMTNLFKSVMKIPFPGNVLAFAAGGATVIGLLNSFKTKGQTVIKAAEGALINKPTLALVGEAVSRSGSELILPEKNFRRYMDTEVMPEFRAKLNAAVSSNVTLNTKSLEDRLDRVESAVREIRPGFAKEISKHMGRNNRKKLS